MQVNVGHDRCELLDTWEEQYPCPEPQWCEPGEHTHTRRMARVRHLDNGKETVVPRYAVSRAIDQVHIEGDCL